MTFIQLVQRLAQEAGVGSGPSTTVSQTGESLRLVNWVNSAWMDIQQDHPDFDWMLGSFTLSTVAADAEYAASDASVTDLREWKRDSLKVYKTSTADETELTYVPYADFRPVYMLGSVSSGRPVAYTVKPDKTIRLWPTPDAVYTVTGEYHKKASELSANSDEPGLSSEYHMAIVYRALIKYARYESAPEIYEDAKTEYRRMRDSIRMNQTADMTLGGPLL